MKLLTVIGARPQFIKAVTVSRQVALRDDLTEVIAHIGQHYDANMSDIFSDELAIPRPDHNLGIGGGTHGAMTGRRLEVVEKMLLDEKPDWVLAYGDTNLILSGELTAVKLHIPVAQVTAGLRSFNRQMPEEINRILTDHAADLLLAPTKTVIDNLMHEGLLESWLRHMAVKSKTLKKFVRNSSLSKVGVLKSHLDTEIKRRLQETSASISTMWRFSILYFKFISLNIFNWRPMDFL